MESCIRHIKKMKNKIIFVDLLNFYVCFCMSLNQVPERQSNFVCSNQSIHGNAKNKKNCKPSEFLLCMSPVCMSCLSLNQVLESSSLVWMGVVQGGPNRNTQSTSEIFLLHKSSRILFKIFL